MKLPTWLDPYLGIAKALLYCAIALALFAAGWEANGWRLGAENARLRATRSDEVAQQYKEAAAELLTSAKKINDAAVGAQIDLTQLGTRLDTIRKDFRNAKPASLPADCRPDAPRVRQLTATANAVDEAIARQRSGR